MAALLALTAAASFGIGDFLGGLASRRSRPLLVVTLATLAGAVVAIPILLVAGGEWSLQAMAFGGAAGLFGAAGLGLLFAGLASGPFQLVSPISAVVSGAVPVLYGLATGDRPGQFAVAGLLIAPPAIWVLAGGTTTIPRSITRQPLLAAVGAGAFFGIFFILLAATPDDAGFAPVLSAKVAGAAALLAWNARSARWATMPRQSVLIAIASGCADMSANGLFLAASRRGSLATVGALVALYPAMNAVLAAAVLGERLGRLQLGGLILALGAGLLLAL